MNKKDRDLVAQTIRLPRLLWDVVDGLAEQAGRSRNRQVEVMLTSMASGLIERSIEEDLDSGRLTDAQLPADYAGLREAIAARRAVAQPKPMPTTLLDLERVKKEWFGDQIDLPTDPGHGLGAVGSAPIENKVVFKSDDLSRESHKEAKAKKCRHGMTGYCRECGAMVNG